MFKLDTAGRPTIILRKLGFHSDIRRWGQGTHMSPARALGHKTRNNPSGLFLQRLFRNPSPPVMIKKGSVCQLRISYYLIMSQTPNLCLPRNTVVLHYNQDCVGVGMLALPKIHPSDGNT